MVTYLPREEADLVNYHLERLSAYRSRNRVKNLYYEAKQKVDDLGTNLPAKYRAAKLAVGFTGTAIDVLEERLEFQGWMDESGNDPYGLSDIFTENDLNIEASAGHLDALITGTGFAMVGAGAAGEPDALITIESPDRVTGEWDRRLRRLSSALAVDEEDNGQPSAITLFLPDEDITAYRRGGLWVEAERVVHGRNRVGVVQFQNRPRGSRWGGRSEITPALRSYTDQAVESLLGMKVHRSFYQAPQRYILNASEGWFQNADGSKVSGWETVSGRMMAVPAAEDPEDPEAKVGQFDPASPTPYIEMVRHYAELVSAEAAIPLTYLGMSTANPPSADAIRALEARLIKKAERRQAAFGRAWREVGALALMIRDGEIPEDYATSVTTKWRDAATPTRSAAADEVTKYVGAGVLPASSSITYDRMGLTPAEQRTLRSEKRREDAKARLDGLAQAANAARQAAPGATEEGEPTEPTDGS